MGYRWLHAKKRARHTSSCARSRPALPMLPCSVDEGVKGALSSISGWHGLNNPWVPGDDAGVDYIYVDLKRNVEKYTGWARKGALNHAAQ